MRRVALCPRPEPSLCLIRWIGSAVALGAIFLTAASAGPVAAALGGTVLETEATAAEGAACACASPKALPSASSVEILAAVGELDVLVPPKAVKVERGKRGLRVLILGDSLALCGFGKALDSRLRKLPQIESVSTYMACGSVPTTWLMSGPLANARTACGFWSIEGSRGQPLTEVRDTFGMEKGRRPGTYSVPKLEQLSAALQPDILVMQNGTNLLSLFSDGQTILPARHGSQIRSYMGPFVQQLAQQGHSLKKVYWVAPPITERVSKEVQDFLFKRMNAYASPLVEFIDSRLLVSHPYRNPMADREHFIGKDMEVWAEKVFKKIEDEIVSGAYASGTAHAGRAGVSKTDLEQPSEGRPAARASFSVLGGVYSEKELLVMHPAHIGQKEEPLHKYEVGGVYRMELIEFEGSPWEAIKRSEQTGRLELLPFIRKEDEARFPSGGR